MHKSIKGDILLRIIAISLVLLCTIFFVGCKAAPENVLEEDVKEETEVEQTTTAIEVDQNLLTVEITVPADIAGEEITQEQCDQIREENGYKSVTLNSDGSVTYVMTKLQHEKMMDNLRATIDQALDEMVASEDYPNVVAIDVNKDYTKFTITTTSTEMTMMDSISILGFYLYGGMYNSYNGTPVDDVETIWINEETGEEIAHTSLKEAMEQQNN